MVLEPNRDHAWTVKSVMLDWSTIAQKATLERTMENTQMDQNPMVDTPSKHSSNSNTQKADFRIFSYCRAPAHFVVKIPDEITTAEAAPMLCGGVTVWSPLVKNGAGPGKRVGIVGVGGLGHFGLLWAKALGCDEVVAISRTNAKKEDAQKMGADRFIATEEEGWAKKNSRSLDLIVCTVSSPNMPLAQYFQLLRTNGQFIQVGAPEDKVPGFSVFALIMKGVKFGGSAIGSPADIAAMLKFAAEKNIHPWIQERPLKDANSAIVDMDAGKARYRYVLCNEKHIAEEKK